MDNGISVVIADDDCYALGLLVDYLRDTGYRAIPVHDGEEAWAALNEETGAVGALILDRKMPNLGGMELLERVRSTPRFSGIPVILQTGMADEAQIAEGIQAGVYYYLTKPFVKSVLTSVVQSAVASYSRYQTLKAEAECNAYCIRMMASGRFMLRTMEEARTLASFLAAAAPDPKRAVVGLCELLLNAVEHGNLDIGFDEKGVLLGEGRLQSEIERRLELPEYRERVVTVELSRDDRALNILIRDQGRGFDPKPFLEIDLKRVTAAHGRGIALARRLGLNTIDFRGCGNEVLVKIRLGQSGASA